MHPTTQPIYDLMFLNEWKRLGCVRALRTLEKRGIDYIPGAVPIMRREDSRAFRSS